MNRTTRKPRRVGVAEAKAQLSRLLGEVGSGPIVVHNRGRDVAVLISVDGWEQKPERTGVEAWLSELASLRARHGGGVDDFEVEPARLSAVNPLRRER